MTEWTKQHDIDLVNAYLGYEVQTCGKTTVCIMDGHTVPLPDMRDRHHGWALDCLDSWLAVDKDRTVHFDLWPETNRRRVFLRRWHGIETESYAEGRSLNEAVAWALWKARGK